MPSQKKVGWAQLRVGVLAIAAMTILGVLIFLLTGTRSVFTRTAVLRTYMGDSSGMASGAPVRLNGILIGSIQQPRLTGSQDPRRIVEIPLEIRGEYLKEIPVDSVAGVTASNLLGDKFINITKGKSSQRVRDGSEVKALEAQDIPELMTQSANILGQFQVTLKRLDTILADVEAGRGNIGKLLRDEELYRRLNATVGEVQKTVEAITSARGTIGKLIYDDALYTDVRASIGRLDGLLDDLQQGRGTAGKLLKDPALYDDARRSIAEVNRLIADLNAGKGTAGKLLKDEQLYREMNQAVAKVSDLIDRVNSGQGTLGQLMVNSQLYESLNGATREMNQLIKDIRADPRKFLRIKLALF